MEKVESYLSFLRLTLGFILLWAFFDKTFGLGFATLPQNSWLQGGSPTAGFLKFGVQGIFAPYFHQLSGSIFIDWLFMLGLIFIGASLVLGIGIKIAGYSGAILMFLLYLSVVPSENNPFLDEHLVYLFLFLIFATGEIGCRFSFHAYWKKSKFVKKHSWLF